MDTVTAPGSGAAELHRGHRKGPPIVPGLGPSVF